MSKTLGGASLSVVWFLLLSILAGCSNPRLRVEDIQTLRSIKTARVVVALDGTEVSTPTARIEETTKTLLEDYWFVTVEPAGTSEADLTIRISGSAAPMRGWYVTGSLVGPPQPGITIIRYSEPESRPYGGEVKGAISFERASKVLRSLRYYGCYLPPVARGDPGPAWEEALTHGGPFYDVAIDAFLPTLLSATGQVFGPEALLAALEEPRFQIPDGSKLALLTRAGIPMAPCLVDSILRDSHPNAMAWFHVTLEGTEDIQKITDAINDVADKEGEPLGAWCIALARINHRPSLERLASACEGRDETARRNAIIALGRIRAKTVAVPVMIELLKSGDPATRFSAALALGRIGDKRALDPLIGALDDPQEEVRCAAATALGRWGGKRTAVPLCKAMTDRNSPLRKYAGKTLRDIPQDIYTGFSWPWLKSAWAANALKDPDPRIRCSAIYAMAWVDKPPSFSGLVRDDIESIVDALDDADTGVREDSLFALKAVISRYEPIPGIGDDPESWRNWWRENRDRFPANRLDVHTAK